MRGPFLFVGAQKFTVKGVTYGTFATSTRGDLFPEEETLRRDLELMRRTGINTLRTYTPPSNVVLEHARAAGLRVLVGIHWEGRDCVFDDPNALNRAEAEVRAAVRRCRQFPDVVLAYVIGNEIPPLTARFFGRRLIERFLRRLYLAAKEEDPEGLVTYGNYPSTEFLQLDFLDFLTLNVYLLERKSLGAYLDRMLIESKGKPLLLGEVGDDSIAKGERRQAELLDWTIPLALDKGVAGVCVFGWTDEWVVGGMAVEDWAFGLVDRARAPKLAHEVVRRRFTQSPFEGRSSAWPLVSVVVCNYNGAATLEETLSSLEELHYPAYEIVYVDDGSTDDSLRIARTHAGRVRIVAQENQGLGVARNVGIHAARGEIVAFIDSDAYADVEWLRFLVLTLESGNFAGAGGPNLTPPSDGLTAQLISACPGNPTCVLVDNVVADHVAGVNMAFRRDALLALGGFDPVHRRAGDDVDICWRLQDAGMSVAFVPAAIVWHHRRPSILRYLRQQLGYGEAEDHLEHKHPERFNLGGHIRWRGRIYQAPRRVSALFRPFIYHGHLGSALFQTLYQKEPSTLMEVPAMVQWYFVWFVLLALAPFSVWLLPFGLAGLGLSLFVAAVSGSMAEVLVNPTRAERARKFLTVSGLHFIHPIVRTCGRIRARGRRLVPRRWTRFRGSLDPLLLLRELALRRGKEARHYWGPGSGDRSEIVRTIQRELKARGFGATLGGEWANFDLQLEASPAVEGRFYTAPEHYDRALCCGYRGIPSRSARAAIAITTAAGVLGAIFVPWLTPLLLAPAVLGVLVLSEAARLRLEFWRVVDEVMATRGAQVFELPDTEPGRG